jgi:hypothetical protein
MRSIVLAVLSLVLLGAAGAQTAGLSGKWKVNWKPERGSIQINRIDLIQPSTNNIDFSGSYSIGDGETCPVLGTNNKGQVSMTIGCEGWWIQTTGVITDGDEDQIVGSYIWSMDYAVEPPTKRPSNVSISGVGRFEMSKQICFLPEGCPAK